MKPRAKTPVVSGFRRTKKSIDADVQSALAWLKRHSTRATLDGMARYAIPSDKALGEAHGLCAALEPDRAR